MQIEILTTIILTILWAYGCGLMLKIENLYKIMVMFGLREEGNYEQGPIP